MSANLSAGSIHYPPAADSWFNLTWAVNGTGSPGIFDSSSTPDNQYGEYNWCAMPHVRASEYKLPSSDHELVYVEVIHRHHKRTPYPTNTFYKEVDSWDCTGVGPYHYGKGSKERSAGIYWQAQTGADSVNPFALAAPPGFEGSACRFPALTTQGLDDAREHGVDLKGVYGDLLGFLPDGEDTDAYTFRVTNNDITSQTLGAVARGLFPKVKEHPAWIQSEAYDSLEPTFSCPYASALVKANEGSNPAWLAHLDASAALSARIDKVANLTSANEDWHASYDHIFDNLSAKQCHAKATPAGLSQQDIETVYRLGQYEYAYRWRGSANATLYATLKMGPWLLELQDHLRKAVQGSKIRYRHNIAHDGSIAPLLGALQMAYPLWPGMGSEVVFELWKRKKSKRSLWAAAAQYAATRAERAVGQTTSGTKGKGKHYLRVLFNGQPLNTSTPLGVLDMVPLEEFEGYLAKTLPRDIVGLCASEP